MIFLYLEKTTGRILCSPEAMTRPEVQRVYQGDKSKDKVHFSAVCTAIYWIFKPRNIYWNKSLAERIKIVNEDYLYQFKTTWEQLAKDANVKAFQDCFIDLCTTLNDRADQNLRNDLDALIEALNNVPTSIDIEFEVGAELMCDDKKYHKVARTVKQSLPNFERKGGLWDYFKTFSKNLKDIQANLKQEEEERVKDGEDVYLFDTPTKNK